MKQFRILVLLLAAAAMSSCLNNDVSFEDVDKTVVTYVYTSPASAPAEIITAGMGIAGVNKYNADFVFSPDSLRTFTEPDAKWVAKHNLTVEYKTFNGRRACIIRPKEGVKRYMFYIHGGAYTRNMDANQYNLIKTYVEELGYGAVLPDYHLAAAYTYQDAYTMLLQAYLWLVSEVGAENVLLMGDSAGAGLAFGFAQYLRNNSYALPAYMIFFSPWLDGELLNPEIDKMSDPMLNKRYLQEAAKYWAGTTDVSDYRISPINGTFNGFPRIHMFIGGRDLLYPDAVKFRRMMKEQHLPLTVYEYPQMFHVWPLYPSFDESKHVYKQLLEIVK